MMIHKGLLIFRSIQNLWYVLILQTSDVRRYKARELIGQVFVAPLLKQRSCVIDAAAVAASADMDENGKTIKEKIDPSHVAPGEFRDR